MGKTTTKNQAPHAITAFHYTKPNLKSNSHNNGHIGFCRKIKDIIVSFIWFSCKA